MNSRTDNVHAEQSPSKKRTKLELEPNPLDLNEKLKDQDVLSQMSTAWQEGTDYTDAQGLSVSNDPFCHSEIENFIASEDFMDSFYDKVLTKIRFHERASDLLKFRQSDSIDDSMTTVSEVKTIRNVLQTSCFDLLLKITNFPLNGHVDMFLSDYQHTDFLLCHDDELESRRIAFILYLTPDWKSEYGGSLDLFSSSKETQPERVIKSITPAFNKFVFFTVTCKSFHQVAEIVQPGVRRFALSGWFYGEAIPRPKIVLPQMEYYTPNTSPLNDVLNDYVTDVYVNEENCKIINERLVESQTALLVDFLKPTTFAKISENLNTLSWVLSGPANLHSFSTCALKLWPFSDELFDPVNALAAFFHSHDFFLLMQQITEYEFDKADSITSSLRKFDHKCYSLIKSDPESGKVQSDSDSDCTDEDETEITQVDLIYYCGSFDWKDEWGGLTIYTDEDGEQLTTVSPQSNSLAVVVRNKSVMSYVNYINSLSRDCSYFTYTMTFTFKGED